MTGTTKFLLGAAAGMVVGLLIAPEKGEDLRNDIAGSAGKLKKQIGKLIGKANGSLEDLKLYLDKNIDGLEDDVKRKIIDILDSAENMAHNAKKRVGNGVLS
jgi:gas vesicle protein